MNNLLQQSGGFVKGNKCDRKGSTASQENYFAKYTAKASRMNGWQLEEELARKLVAFDELKEEKANMAAAESLEKTMREIEILQTCKEKKSSMGANKKTQPPLEESAEKIPISTSEIETSTMAKWLTKASNWDLARELDRYKNERDVCQRKIGLMDFDAKYGEKNFQSLTAESLQKDKMIELLKSEMIRRGIRN